ncbi:MAG TPA: hypothetical protein VM055_05955 [Novosphingobium sp.]|nr:hypothetical protein [Novosphingobium sp.]
MSTRRNRLTMRGAIALALAAATLSAPVAAQDRAAPTPDARIKKIEAEVRALQRKVFPDGAVKYFEPEIAQPNAAVANPSVPTGGAVTDLLARLDTVEAALARATAQNEENANRMSKLEARLTALEAGNAAVSAQPAPAGVEPLTPATPSRSITGTVNANAAAMTTTAAAKPSAANPSSERIAAVAAIEKPASADKGEDDYLYGYRLWEAKFFPEAQQQLKATVDKYPRHARVSYARNLLGRAYLDDGKPGMAAQAFLQNYQANKAGDRAADSLLYLGVAMTRLKETQRACVALQEFGDVYAAEAAGRLASQYGAAKAAVKCN